MPTKPGPVGAKANGDGAKTAKAAWNPEDSITLLLIIMQENNPDLSVTGWKAIKERAQAVFENNYGMEGAK